MKHVSAYLPPSRSGMERAQPPRSAGATSIRLRLLAVALAIATVAILLKLTGTLDYLSFPALARNREWLAARVEDLGFAGPAIFVTVYTVCTVLSLPTGLLLSTLAGFLFGHRLGRPEQPSWSDARRHDHLPRR